MRVDLDAKVFASDGREVGSVQRAVFDPASNRVVDLVVSTGTFLGRDVLVPVDAVEPGDAGDHVRLRLTKEQIEKLPAYVEASYVPPPPGWIPPGDLGLAYGSYLWPATTAPLGGASAGAPPEATKEPDHFALAKGSVVLDSRGEDVGVVDDVRFDATSGELLGFDLRIGGVLATLFGGGDRLAVDASQVEKVREGAVYLTIDKRAIEARARR